MAVDTLTKRSAALRYGRGRTRQPEAVPSVFVRGAGLGLYYLEVVTTDPNDGWIAESRRRLSISNSRDRVSVPSTRDRVWISQDKVE